MPPFRTLATVLSIYADLLEFKRGTLGRVKRDVHELPAVARTWLSRGGRHADLRCAQDHDQGRLTVPGAPGDAVIEARVPTLPANCWNAAWYTGSPDLVSSQATQKRRGGTTIDLGVPSSVAPRDTCNGVGVGRKAGPDAGEAIRWGHFFSAKGLRAGA